MNNKLSEESLKYIIGRLIANANEARDDSKKEADNDFQAGRHVAYYEMLDIIQSELDARDVDLAEFGIDIDLEKTFL